jgi:hypothetical protein
MLPIRHHEGDQCGLVRVLERLQQHGVRPLKIRLGRDVVRGLQIDRVHLGGIHELHHVDRAGAGRGSFVEGGVLHEDEATIPRVAAHQLLPLDLALALRAVHAVVDTTATDPVNLMEPDRERPGGDVQLDGDRDEAEGDDPLPDGHRAVYLRCAIAAVAVPGLDRGLGLPLSVPREGLALLDQSVNRPRRSRSA